MNPNPVFSIPSNLVILLILLTGFVFQSCEKNEKDYREPYTGYFNFTTVMSSFDTTIADSVVHYSGSVSIGSNNNEIIIKYIPQYTINVYLTSEGKLDEPFSWGLSVTFWGEFESPDKLTFTISWLPGIYNTHNVTGIRR